MPTYIVLAFAIGILLFFIGLTIRIARDGKMFTFMVIIGVLLLIVSFYAAIDQNQKGTESLLEDIAIRLNANTSDIIVENISKSSLFTSSKNTNLRKVYYEGKTYLVEVTNYKVEKIVEQPSN